jgi:hypothetical protein
MRRLAVAPLTRRLALAPLIWRLALAASSAAVLVAGAALLIGLRSPSSQPAPLEAGLAAAASAPRHEHSPATTSPPVPAALVDAGLDLRAPAAPVPLELRLPSLDARAAMLGVGINTADVMDAPMGPASDPVWQEAFWYRGSAVPGAASTALIAGHVNDPLGRPGVFAHIDALRPGDPIVVRDTRTGLDIRFSVTESVTYSLAQAAEPAILARIYGAGPVAGTAPQPSADGLSHLTLITCAGTFRNGTHDHRLVVYATRT